MSVRADPPLRPIRSLAWPCALWLFAAMSASPMPCLGASAAALEYRIEPKLFTDDDGLPASGVNAVVQARDGYLWIGTYGGLARFDGQSFWAAKSAAAASRTAAMALGGGPPSDRILALLEDARGRLWIGTEDAGLSVYEHGAFRHLPVCAGSCRIAELALGADGAVWAVGGAGVLRLGPDGSERWIEPRGRDGYQRVVAGADGRIYVGGYAGLRRVEGESLRKLALPAQDDSVWLLERDGNGLLVGTERDLYRYDPAADRWQAQHIGRPSYAARDAQGRWWVALTSGELLREDAAGAWTPLPELAGLGISRMASDNEGNVWIGTASKGLMRVRPPLFGVLSAARSGRRSPGRAVVEDAHGELWFGSSCGGDGLHRLQRDGELRAVALPAGLRPDLCVTSLLADRDGALWLGTASGELLRLDGERSEWVVRDPGEGAINIWQLADGGHVVGTERSTFYLERDDRGRYGVRREIAALRGMRVVDVVASARGGYWFVGDQGVARIVGARVAERWAPEQGLSSRFARALYEDAARDAVWVGTYGGGLNRIADGRVRRYGSGNGLYDDTVSCILPDASGRLWLAGNRGVTLLPHPARAGAAIASVGYGAGDGLVPAEVNGGASAACLRDSRGRLWFSLVEGFGVVDPTALRAVATPQPSPRVERVSVGGRALPLLGGAVRLTPFSRNLEIRYTAISLSKPKQTRFRIRLSGVDRDWVEMGQGRSIAYPSVPWGAHRFQVQARIAGGAWSPAAAELLIVHPQPWYLRPWIWTLATLLGLIVLVGSTRSETPGAKS